MFSYRDWPAGLRLCGCTLATLFAVLISPITQANPPQLLLSEQMNGLSATPHTSYLEDPDGTLTFQQIRSEPLASSFKAIPKGNTNFGFSDSVFWIRLDVTNPGEETLPWYLEVPHPQWDHLTFYHLNPDMTLKTLELGDHKSFWLRPVIAESFIFPVNSPSGSLGRIWVRMAYDQTTRAETQLKLWSVKAFELQHDRRLMMVAGVIGGGLILALYNLFLGISTGGKEYLWYVAYILAAIVTFVVLVGFSQRLLGNQPALVDALPILAPLTMLAFAAQFSRSFLQTRGAFPNIDRFYRFQVGLCVLAIALFGLGYRELCIFAVLSCALLSTAFPFLAMYIYQQGHREARFYVLAWCFWSTSVALVLMRNFGVINTNMVTNFLPAAGLLIDGVLLSFALGDRINVLGRLKEQAEKRQLDNLQESKDKLESQVLERTAELEAAKTAAETLAMTDFLTGSANRRAFFEFGEREILRAERYHRPLSIIMIDIDRFKHINDTHGHGGGDQVIKALIAAVREQARDSDIVGRLGGEEFAIILPETQQLTAFKAAERLRQRVEDLVLPLGGANVSFTASFGVAQRKEGELSISSLLERTDRALYLAKEEGRNRVETAS